LLFSGANNVLRFPSPVEEKNEWYFTDKATGKFSIKTTAIAYELYIKSKEIRLPY
jgi:hypothetical protein